MILSILTTMTFLYRYFILTLLPLCLWAEHYMIDDVHQYLSEKVIDVSEYSDTTIAKWFDNNETNQTCFVSPKKKRKKRNVDAFFQNNKYLEETDDTFIRVRSDNYVQSKEKNKYRLKFDVQFPFSRCRKYIKFFIENLSADKNNLSKKTEKKNTKPEIGFNFISTQKSKIKSKYSIGLGGFKPFVRARYNLPFEYGFLDIDPVQTVKYSQKYRIEEKTDIYIDAYPEQSSMLRLILHRGTKEIYSGMDYSVGVEYYLSAKDDVGLRFSQQFKGDTKYYTLQQKEYKGVHDYISTVTWRSTVWRKWFYYELSPSVNFHERHQYKPNYAIRFFLDFYFGTQKTGF